ncbi:hypothetical protein GCM10007209_38060 [Haloferax sulfurifontis]|uniref:Uncharacterized protein n=2 Tax=Haloferax sulfurifontis TaxID=255616 RepID=A0A830EAU6_9EURY|nr:hypothetical protein GCM10007209_38060 [Haloferax sulfurifontis]
MSNAGVQTSLAASAWSSGRARSVDREYTRVVTEHRQSVETVRCPICEKHRDDWSEQKTSAHYRREDHTWAALEAAMKRRRGER